jgi:hypothetical protein
MKKLAFVMLIPKIEKQPQKSKEKQGFNIEQHSIE